MRIEHDTTRYALQATATGPVEDWHTLQHFDDPELAVATLIEEYTRLIPGSGYLRVVAPGGQVIAMSGDPPPRGGNRHQRRKRR